MIVRVCSTKELFNKIILHDTYYVLLPEIDIPKKSNFWEKLLLTSCTMTKKVKKCSARHLKTAGETHTFERLIY